MQMIAAETNNATDSLPPAPRALSARARRRSWAEMSVRVWMILSIIVFLAAIYFTAKQITGAMTTRRLILHGAPVIAHIDAANGVKDIGRQYDRRDRNTAHLTFTGPDRVKRTVQGDLSPQNGMFAIGYTIELRVDPNDPMIWTD